MSCSCCDPYGVSDDSDFGSDFEHEEVSVIDAQYNKITKFVIYLRANAVPIDSSDELYKESYSVFFANEKYDLSIDNVKEILAILNQEEKIAAEKEIKNYIVNNVKGA